MCGQINDSRLITRRYETAGHGVPRAPEREDVQVPGAHVSSLPDKKAAGFLGAACDDWLLFHDDGGLFRVTSPVTGKTRLLPSFHGVRAHDGPVEIVNEAAPSLLAVTTQWRDDEAMAVRKLMVLGILVGVTCVAARHVEGSSISIKGSWILDFVDLVVLWLVVPGLLNIVRSSTSS